MSNVFEEIAVRAHALWAKLVADSHPAAEDAKAILDAAERAAKADGEKVITEVKPVVEEVVKDVETIAVDAAETAVEDAAKTAIHLV